MSTPSKPYVVIRLWMLLAKLVAADELATETEPFWPPTEMMTFCPRECSVVMSAVSCASVYPPSALDRPESTWNVTPPALFGSASANATAIRSYVVGTDESFSAVAPLTKFCQYPVSRCFGSVPPVVQPLVVPVTVAEPDSPVPLYARTA